ncbi:FAD-binding oxidoreductase [Kribbella sancticallisti]|uniref:FAD-binding oxidoreductase n=1 Tax=Kribbella sancticallisti TaxID=460087 RepID=A0ABN2DLX4_9ACTN
MNISVAALDGGKLKVRQTEVEELGTRLRGTALLGDPGNTDGRGVFNAMYTAEPSFTVYCATTSDVVQAVKFARERGLLVAVRGGGHSIAGLSTVDGGMLIDLSAMSAVVVDPERRLVDAQGGALWGHVDRETQLFGLATPGGFVADTGIAGLTLGGGYGHLRRRYGLSCDNVVEAQVVDAEGNIHRASAEANPDLYWALRGGGGNFGLVTSFRYRLHPVGPEVAFAACFHPIENVAELLGSWRSFAASAPDEVSSVFITVTLPENPHVPQPVQGRACAVMAGVHAGDVEDGMKALQPIRDIGTPIFDLSQPMPYTAVQSAFDALYLRGKLRAYWKSQYVDDLSDEVIGVLTDAALSRPAPLSEVNLAHMGGAIGAVGPEDSAFPERSAPFLAAFVGYWDDAAGDDECIAWARSAWDNLARFGTGRSYFNFTGLAGEPPSTAVDTVYGPNLTRLRLVKKAYDPDNFFRRNNNITPAS